ncbi:MAG: glycerophosphodiester phosphodiesterase [Acidibacillus sp.]|nr:glycerophosphodiester phosphodiesterase [Acidibacillus sp.]
MEIWAHRGASAVAPENTMAAFVKAYESGADAIEVDVQRTSDGVLVIMHDETVNRTTQGRGYIYSASFAWLSQLDAGYKFSSSFHGERVPTLDQTLSFVESTSLRINIELKIVQNTYVGIEEQVIDAIKQRDLTDRVVISSFHYPSLHRIKQLDPNQAIGLLCTQYNAVTPMYAKQFGAEAVHPHWKTISPTYMNEAFEQNIKIRPYTVNDPRIVRTLNAWGIDAVITNHPGLVRKVITTN